MGAISPRFSRSNSHSILLCSETTQHSQSNVVIAWALTCPRSDFSFLFLRAYLPSFSDHPSRNPVVSRWHKAELKRNTAFPIASTQAFVRNPVLCLSVVLKSGLDDG